jgi:hypothetical protein
MDAPEKKEGEKQENQQTLLQPDALQKLNYAYANSTFVYSSNWDVRFVFGERFPITRPGGSEVVFSPIEPRVGIVMSYQQAKSFYEAFSKIIESVETKMGPIRYLPLEPEQEKPSTDSPSQSPKPLKRRGVTLGDED